MSKTRFVRIVTVVEVQVPSSDAALKLVKKYVDINTGPGDTVNIVEDQTRFYDITEDYIFYELYDEDEWYVATAHNEDRDETEDDEEVSDSDTSSAYDPLINYNHGNPFLTRRHKILDDDNDGRTFFDAYEDRFDDDGGRTYFDANEESRLLKLEIEEDAEVDKAINSALDQAHKDTREYQENGRTYFDVDKELRLAEADQSSEVDSNREDDFVPDTIDDGK